MLSVSGTPIGRAFAHAQPIITILAGSAGVMVGAYAMEYLLSSYPHLDRFEVFHTVLSAIPALLGGALGVVAGAFDLRRIWLRGGFHIALLANARTLAVVRFRAPTRYIKRRECAALGSYGHEVILLDGQKLALRCDGVRRSRLVREFTRPLFARWWAPVTLGHVRQYFDRNMPAVHNAEVAVMLIIPVVAWVLLITYLATAQSYLLAVSAALIAASASLAIQNYLEKRVERAEFNYALAPMIKERSTAASAPRQGGPVGPPDAWNSHHR